MLLKLQMLIFSLIVGSCTLLPLITNDNCRHSIIAKCFIRITIHVNVVPCKMQNYINKCEQMSQAATPGAVVTGKADGTQGGTHQIAHF